MIRTRQLVADCIKTIGVILSIDGTMNRRGPSPLARCVSTYSSDIKQKDLDMHTKCILRIVCEENKESVAVGRTQRDEL